MKKQVILSTLLGLTGCGMYTETFECSPGKGVGCLALHQVDAQVDQQTLPFQLAERQQNSQAEKTEKLLEAPLADRVYEGKNLDPSIFARETERSAPWSLADQKPLGEGSSKRRRVAEKFLKVWIAPYEDEAGDYHEAAIVHIVTHPGRWEGF